MTTLTQFYRVEVGLLSCGDPASHKTTTHIFITSTFASTTCAGIPRTPQNI